MPEYKGVETAELVKDRVGAGLPARETPLTAYFALNQSMKPEIQDLLDKHTFETIYEDFSYNKDQQAWNKRTKSEKAAKDTIVRIAHVAPRNRELHVFFTIFLLFFRISCTC